ncbi:hypothetical protein FFI89_018695 [Bradyrhizobium sp. KBS0727]|uniref:hypothetical protein n=1 Tax=unclassified Bradyrhizobium TaxID=2631580 RepID=UPI00110E78FE|nr:MULTISPECIES: hypothetical protein [unclassified Bradyrhizobium]QDW38994.1 hypothetical protein FFI71_018695 [Bradyrhizobium sp. KBS0725]QDW45597.1 hypothetical protein FFI89_018695 [Bradyrhizobium sp. KBS0727]
MLRIAFAGALALCLVALNAGTAEARRHRPQVSTCSNLDPMRPCGVGFLPPGDSVRAAQALKRSSGIRMTRADRARPGPSYGPGGLAAGLVAPLAAKVAEIRGACRSSLISGMRHTLIAGTRMISLHASGRAADLAGDPSCIYAHLAGWPGGYSVDYARMRHVHISYDEGGREWGLHFRHGGGARHARRHHPHIRLVVARTPQAARARLAHR